MHTGQGPECSSLWANRNLLPIWLPIADCSCEGPWVAVALDYEDWRCVKFVALGAVGLHPEQTLDGADVAKILVSINWNGVDFYSDILGNADLGKPRFYAVTLP